jgi:Kef-type K+ transport system membrane component KefB/mannitol/fructose-specific phosphotransferase system IIA component (Ntr-type)
MDRLAPNEVLALLLSLGVLLAAARFFGEIAKRFGQPSVLGELLAGIVLGPSVFGAMAPHFASAIFPLHGHVSIALDGLTTVAIVLFLLVAGMEVDLSTVWRQGKAAMIVSTLGILVPFVLGFATAWSFPGLVGHDPRQQLLIFALFFATALSISALPVIAKTLMDVNMYRSDFGMLIIASAIMNDLVGWIVFALIIGMMGGAGVHGPGIGNTIWITLAFAGLMLTVGRVLIHRALPWLQAHTSWPGGVLAFALTLSFLGAAFTEWVGVHAIFGSFLVGVALGDSSHLREQTRATIDRFVSFIFAPLFFASIGLKINFIANFDPLLVVIILAIATVGKVFGCGIGARISGKSARESWAVGFGMNSRGTMEIILGLLALQLGVINERMFVALVVMAIVTSMMSGPLIQTILQLKKPRRFTDHMSAKAFIVRAKSADRRGVIAELVAVLGNITGKKADELMESVWEREQILATGLGHGLAVPHARVENLQTPLLALGISREGIDFDAPDGLPAHIIFLLLTPSNDDGAQLELLADIARTFSDAQLREKVLRVSGYTEFLALMRSERRD